MVSLTTCAFGVDPFCGNFLISLFQIVFNEDVIYETSGFAPFLVGNKSDHFLLLIGLKNPGSISHIGQAWVAQVAVFRAADDRLSNIAVKPVAFDQEPAVFRLSQAGVTA